MNQCCICGESINKLDPAAFPPACSKECFWILTHAVSHKNTPCWISAEILCEVGEAFQGTSEVFYRTGYCDDCRIFKTETEVRKRGLDKEKLIGNY